jgi:hypothetical protein
MLMSGTATFQDGQMVLNSDVDGSGYSLGNAGGWTTAFGEVTNLNVSRRGITQLHGGEIVKHAVGDVAGIYKYVRTDGGATAMSDEGASGITAQMLENQGYFHGTVISTKGKGDRAPVLTCTGGNNWTTDGAYLLNISKGTIAGSLAGPSQSVVLTTDAGPVTTFLYALPVAGVTLPISSAIGIATAPITPPVVDANSPVVMTVTVTLCKISGAIKPFTAGSVVSVAGINYPEQSVILTANVPTATGQQTLTLKLRNPNQQAVLFEDGIQGQYISFPQNLAFSGMRSSYFAFGSQTGTDLIYGFQTFGTLQNGVLPMLGAEAATADAPFNLFPGAEVVKNTGQGFACELEQNGVAWAPDDVVECPHNPCFAGGAAFFVHQQYTPSFSGGRPSSIALIMEGPGIGGPGTQAVRIINNNPLANFRGNGGPIQAPFGHCLEGAYTHHLYVDTAPDTGSIVFVQNLNNPKSTKISVVNLDFVEGGEMTFDVVNKRYHMDSVDACTFSTYGTLGVSGSFKSADGKTVTVNNGLITGIE